MTSVHLWRLFSAFQGLVLVALCSCSHGSKGRSASEVPPQEETLSDEDEYKLGRNIAAKILEKYPPIASQFNRYGSVMAQYLAMHSARPTTFKGYRVQLISSSEVAAFSTPGGFIFVSKPLVATANSEDELAGVIAHEVAHVVLRHGEMAVRKKMDAERERKKSERNVNAISSVVGGVAKVTAGDQNDEVASGIYIANESYSKVLSPVYEQLLVSGYNHDQEYAADKLGLSILLDSGYNPKAFANFLERNFSLSKRLVGKKEGGGFFATHPLDETRIKRIREMIKGWRPGPPSKKREERFRAMKLAL